MFWERVLEGVGDGEWNGGLDDIRESQFCQSQWRLSTKQSVEDSLKGPVNTLSGRLCVLWYISQYTRSLFWDHEGNVGIFTCNTFLTESLVQSLLNTTKRLQSHSRLYNSHVTVRRVITHVHFTQVFKHWAETDGCVSCQRLLVKHSVPGVTQPGSVQSFNESSHRQIEVFSISNWNSINVYISKFSSAAFSSLTSSYNLFSMISTSPTAIFKEATGGLSTSPITPHCDWLSSSQSLWMKLGWTCTRYTSESATITNPTRSSSTSLWTWRPSETWDSFRSASQFPEFCKCPRQGSPPRKLVTVVLVHLKQKLEHTW
jgi:hypothetical protein